MHTPDEHVGNHDITPTVSVVIPSIGRSTLERAVLSVVGQSSSLREVIVVDNGPEPLGPERLADLGNLATDTEVRLVSLPPFSGAAISRNLGAWLATTTFVAFLDDDDEFAPGYLGEMLHTVTSSEADIVYGTWSSPNGIDSAARLGLFSPTSWLDLAYNGRNPGFGGSNIVVRRSSFLRLGGFSLVHPAMEDRAFGMAAIRDGAAIGYARQARVLTHTPEGLRTNSPGLDKWTSGLRLTIEYWNRVPWRSRIRALWRLARSLPLNLRRETESRNS